jgi:hypothetical protein
VDQGVAREYSRTGGGAPPSRADGEKRHDQRHDDWSEMSDSGDSLITEVLRASNMDPHNSKMREAMAHMLREAETLVGSGGDPSGRSVAPRMLATPQSHDNNVGIRHLDVQTCVCSSALSESLRHKEGRYQLIEQSGHLLESIDGLK